jgi:hypothetical protein
LKGRDHFKDQGKDRRCNKIESERNADGMMKTGLT